MLFNYVEIERHERRQKQAQNTCKLKYYIMNGNEYKNMDTKHLSSNEVRAIIIDRISRIDRPGIDHLLEYIRNDRNGYFSVSCHSHHKFIGGMAKHALGVYLDMRQMNARNNHPSNDDSLALIGLCHDICNTPGCRHRDLPGRHGYRSVALLESLGVKLRYAERYAIANHMRGSHPNKWKKANELGWTAEPDSPDRLLYYMKCDGHDASRFPRTHHHHSHRTQQPNH